MPTRLLFEKITVSVTLAELTAEEERFFYRLLVKCDDHGRFHAHPAILLGQLFSLQAATISVEDVRAWRDRLEEVGLIQVYVADGREYLAVSTWTNHQRRRASSSKYPEPPIADDGAHPHADADNGRSRDVLTGSRYPVPGDDTRRPIPGSRETVRAEAREPRSRSTGTDPPDRLEPNEDDVGLGRELGLDVDQVRRAAASMLDYYRSKAERRADWHATLRRWLRKTREFDAPARASPSSERAVTNGIYGEIETVEGIRT